MTSNHDRLMTEARVISAVAPYVPSPVTGLTPLAGSVSNQDLMVHTTAGDFVLKIGDRNELSAEAWACERVRTVGVAGPEIIAFEPSPASLPRPFLLMRRLPAPASIPHRTMHSSKPVGNSDWSTRSCRRGTVGATRNVGSIHRRSAELSGELVDRHVVSPDLAGRIGTTLDHFRPAVRFDEPGALLHGDLKPPNVFAEHETFAVYRVIRMTTTLLYELRWGGDWFDSYRTTIEADLELLGRL